MMNAITVYMGNILFILFAESLLLCNNIISILYNTLIPTKINYNEDQ